jgi:hypothetical protein
MAGMSRQDIAKLINRYIGVSGGYLGDFSYRTHRDFYPEYCDLFHDTGAMPGTTRHRFETILINETPPNQAKIIRGILAKYPPDSEQLSTRTQELHDYFIGIASQLEGNAVNSPDLEITSAVVERAIADAESLIQTNGATSSVDRVHTMLHGYLKAVCDVEEIEYSDDVSMRGLLRLLREQYPALSHLGPRAQDVERVFQSIAVIMDAMNPIRNRASVAHPNEELLDEPEAMLVINCARTLLHYLDCKLSGVSCK